MTMAPSVSTLLLVLALALGATAESIIHSKTIKVPSRGKYPEQPTIAVPTGEPTEDDFLDSAIKHTGKIVDEYYEELENDVQKLEGEIWGDDDEIQGYDDEDMWGEDKDTEDWMEEGEDWIDMDGGWDEEFEGPEGTDIESDDDIDVDEEEDGSSWRRNFGRWSRGRGRGRGQGFSKAYPWAKKFFGFRSHWNSEDSSEGYGKPEGGPISGRRGPPKGRLANFKRGPPSDDATGPRGKPGFRGKLFRGAPQWLVNVGRFLGRGPTIGEKMAAQAQFMQDLHQQKMGVRVAHICQKIWSDKRDRFVAALRRGLERRPENEESTKSYKIDFIERLRECCSADDKLECVTDLHRERNDNFCEMEAPLKPWSRRNPKKQMANMKDRCCELEGEDRHQCFGKMRRGVWYQDRASGSWEDDSNGSEESFDGKPNHIARRMQRRRNHDKEIQAALAAKREKLTRFQGMRKQTRDRCCDAGRKAAMTPGVGERSDVCAQKSHWAARQAKSFRPTCKSSFRECCLNVISGLEENEDSQITTAIPMP